MPLLMALTMELFDEPPPPAEYSDSEDEQTPPIPVPDPSWANMRGARKKAMTGKTKSSVPEEPTPRPAKKQASALVKEPVEPVSKKLAADHGATAPVDCYALTTRKSHATT